MPNMAPLEGGSENAITDKVDNSEIIWGKKGPIGAGPKGKHIQFYNNFTYDGEEYFRYDCVYLHAEGEPEPYIGKIMKIWEDRKEKKNKMKVMWFFRPIELSTNYLEDESCPSNKEIFLAAGEGKGVYNINLLEVIVGKCKVLCTSPNRRNPQPSEEDLNNADYCFYRTFDVREKIVAEISDNVTGIEADVIFNKKSWVSNPIALLDQQANSVKGDKTMENGSLENEISESGIQEEEQMKKKGEKEVRYQKEAVKEQDVQIIPKDKAKEDEITSDELNENKVPKEKVNNQFPKEENQNAQSGDEKLEGNEKKDDIAKTDISKEKLKWSQSPNEEQEKNEIAMELKNSETPKEQEKENDIAKEKLKKAEPEILSKIPSKEGVPKKSLQLEVRSTEKKDNKNESSKEGKKPLKRTRVMIDSFDEDETRIQMEGYENDSRKTLDSKKESTGSEIKVVKKAKLIDSSVKSEGIPKSMMQLTELTKEKKRSGEIIVITKKPEVESNKWFRGLPWDERLQKGYEQKAVIRIQNFDPSYTSSEIEDVMWHMLGERCDAKVLPRSLFCNPRSGDALVVFKTKEGADIALKKLNQTCLMFSDGRPLIASKAGPVVSGKQKYAGHISVEKHKLLMHRSHRSEDMRKAVSTSHHSQGNTIEYEMAMDWRLLQEKSERWWKELYKQEAAELEKKTSVKQKNQILMKKN